MNADELKEVLEEILRYFDLFEDEDMEEWPMVSIYSGGRYYRGVVEDELYDVLIKLKEIHDNLED